MKWILLGMWLGAAAVLPCAAQQAQQEVVLSASAGNKLGIAMPAPQVTGLEGDLVNREFYEVVLKDLEEAGPFAILKEKLPQTTDAASYKNWIEAGAEWLLLARVGRLGTDEVEVVLQVMDVKPGKPVFSKRYTGKDGALRRIAHTLSDDLVFRLTGEKGVAATRILFVRQLAPGMKEVFQVDRDGANIKQLTNHKSLTLSPTVAPDGRIAYMTYKGGPPEIWGQRKADGPHVKLFPLGPKSEGQCSSPVWSPDGKRLAFVLSHGGVSDILLLDMESSRVRRLTDSNCINTEPTWNPAGTQIAFTSDRDGGPQIYLMEEDGSNVRRITKEGGYNASPTWSPTGSMIAYVSRFEAKFDLFVYKLGEGKSYQITTGVASSESPDWSPDERRIVFTSGSAGGMQIYTTDLSGNVLRRLMDMAGCQSPKWTRTR